MRVGIIGLGRMGGALARKLVEKGLEVHGWNRTPEKAKGIKGLIVEKNPRELSRNADVIVVAVSDDHAVRRVVYGGKGVLAAGGGKVLLVLSTITPELSMELDQDSRELSIDYVEGPVLGGPKTILDGKSVGILASRSPGALEDAEKLYRMFCKDIFPVGEPPKAMAAKLSVNALYFTILGALGESLALSSRWGVEPHVLRKIGESVWLKPIFDKYYERGLHPRGEAGFTLSLAAKDLMYALRASWMKKTSFPVISGALQDFTAAEKGGYGEKDYPTLLKWMLED